MMMIMMTRIMIFRTKNMPWSHRFIHAVDFHIIIVADNRVGTMWAEFLIIDWSLSEWWSGYSHDDDQDIVTMMVWSLRESPWADRPLRGSLQHCPLGFVPQPIWFGCNPDEGSANGGVKINLLSTLGLAPIFSFGCIADYSPRATNLVETTGVH